MIRGLEQIGSDERTA